MTTARRISELSVGELQPGDQVINKGRLVYTVIEVLRDEPDERLLRVQWLDGGFDIRRWSGAEDLGHTIEVVR